MRLEAQGLPATPGELIDRYIAGSAGAWRFCIPIAGGRAIQGGHYDTKREARQGFCQALAAFLDDPNAFLDRRPVKHWLDGDDGE